MLVLLLVVSGVVGVVQDSPDCEVREGLDRTAPALPPAPLVAYTEGKVVVVVLVGR